MSYRSKPKPPPRRMRERLLRAYTMIANVADDIHGEPDQTDASKALQRELWGVAHSLTSILRDANYAAYLPPVERPKEVKGIKTDHA